MTQWPTVTFGLLSWNRLHYLKATLESARECIQYPNLEWIVSDNQSTEPGLRDYLDSQDWIDSCIYKQQTHAEAMNQLVEMASGKYLFIWPEDVQFVVEGDWLLDIVEILENNQDIGSVGLNGIRQCTLRDFFCSGWKSQVRRGIQDLCRFKKIRRPRTMTSSRGFSMRSLGGATPGICGSGIPTITRTSIWKTLGGWKFSAQGASLIDSSLGAEDYMVDRFNKSGMPLQMAILDKPVAADIITDPTGCKAKVRGDYRFGVYMPPPVSPYYYEIRKLSDLDSCKDGMPLSFFDVVNPIGFTVPRDEHGDHLKSALNTSVVFDIKNHTPVSYPMQDSNVMDRL